MATKWSRESICIDSPTTDTHSIAKAVYARTCRTNFHEPGFCVVNFGDSVDSVSFRQMMVDLKCAMADIHERQTQHTLIYLSAARFDQQETTRPHLDGGPEECFLMLGYEPSEVDSEIEISDYTKCAFDLGLSPQEFMATHNPMFKPGFDLLRPYATRIPCFSRRDYQIVCINNSKAPFSVDQVSAKQLSAQRQKWQGTLHTATILNPDESKRRVINSTMIATASIGTSESVTQSQLSEFISTPNVRRRGYDKPHLKDE